MKTALLLAVMLAACTRGIVQPVAIVAWPQAPKQHCALPVLPQPTIVVGWPDANRIYVTKEDLQALLQHQGEMHVWAETVAACIGRMTE